MLLHLKKVSGSNASLFAIGYEIVGIPVDASGAELSNVTQAKDLFLKLPSTRFTELPYQFSDGKILRIQDNCINTNNSVWQFTIISP